jgi:hypothetical protein
VPDGCGHRNMVPILRAGLAGGGAEMSLADVAGLTHEDGAAGFVSVVTALLIVTFGGNHHD